MTWLSRRVNAPRVGQGARSAGRISNDVRCQDTEYGTPSEKLNEARANRQLCEDQQNAYAWHGYTRNHSTGILRSNIARRRPVARGYLPRLSALAIVLQC
jgi:hypothetical protein